eukprot:1182600-Prorocentrum_minimum.AAC.2
MSLTNPWLNRQVSLRDGPQSRQSDQQSRPATLSGARMIQRSTLVSWATEQLLTLGMVGRPLYRPRSVGRRNRPCLSSAGGLRVVPCY